MYVYASVSVCMRVQVYACLCVCERVYARVTFDFVSECP